MTAIIEDAKTITIDKWGTLNTAASPTRLPDGHSPRNQNVWMDEKPGSVVTAKGFQKLGDIPSGVPPTLLLNFFKTSDGSSQLIVSDNSTIWHTTNYVDYTSIKTGLSGFFQLRAKVIRDKVWFTNGSDAVATWDGTTYTELDGTGGTPDVPTGKYIEYHDERVWIYGIATDLSACRFSSLADSSGTEIEPTNANAWSTDNEIQVSEGDADQGTGIFLYRGFLYCSKQYSIWRIVGDDEYTYSRTKTKSSTGTRFQESIQIKDNLVHFIGVDGLYVFDGEEARRISDIVDPSSSESGVFTFRNLQQPLLNNAFWNVSEAAEFNAGTVPTNLQADDNLTLIPADDSQADFDQGTHDDTLSSLGVLQMDYASSGGSSVNLASTATPSLNASDSVAIIGSASALINGSTSAVAGFNHSGRRILDWRIMFGGNVIIGRIVFRNFYAEAKATNHTVHTFRLEYYDGASWSPLSGGTLTFPSFTLDNARTPSYQSAADPNYYIDATSFDVSLSAITCQGIRVMLDITPPTGGWWVTAEELQVFRAAYETTGKFISKTLDYGSVPGSFGALAASITTNGQSYQFFTQSSDDGSTWDAEANVPNFDNVDSTLRRYLRWGVYLTSDGTSTPTIDKVFVGGTYISEIHDTGGNIAHWAALQMLMNKAGQTINAYFRAATTSGGVSAASWTQIVPGAVPNTDITNKFIQIKVQFSTTSVTQAPYIEGFTVNWVLSSSSGASVLQNVASFIWLNRYWLAAATLGATENDVIIILGKSTFESPWQMKDWKFLTFCRFQDIFIGGSSEDGGLYQLETGYSKNGAAMDSYYETRDVSVENFFLKGRELLVTADRSGPYNLSVGWSTDGGLTYTEKTIDLTRESGESLSFTKRLNINLMSDMVRFRVRINAADQPFSVDDLQFIYKESPQRGTLV